MRAKIFKVKVLNLIGKKENLGKLNKIINSKEIFDFYINDKPIKIKIKSFRRISNLISMKLEENLVLTYINNHNKNESFNDSNDLFIGHQNQNSNVDKMIFDIEEKTKKDKLKEDNENFEETDPLKLNLLDKYNKYNIENQNSSISKEIIKKVKKHNIIANNYEKFLILWEIFYCIISLLAVNILIHLIVLIINLWMINTYYIFYCGVLLSFLLYSGIKSVYKIMKDREREICLDLTNQFIIFSCFVTLFVWVIIQKVEKDVQKYIINKTHYNLLFILTVIFELLVIFQNYTMREVYREYDLILKTIKE